MAGAWNGESGHDRGQLPAGALARGFGLDGSAMLVMGYGGREIVTGLAILSEKDPTNWVWARVGGDALDLGTLATALAGRNPRKAGAALAVLAVAGVTVLDVACALALSARPGQASGPVRDYSDRSGLPRSPDAMRGAARNG